MSDAYDSLDEETDCSYSLDSLDSIRGILKCDRTNRFFDGEKLKERRENRVYINKRKENVLPKIENRFVDEGCKTDAVNDFGENEILIKRKLQLNKDGSITKSPETECEDLPFVTREYRNLQFQKRKIYDVSDIKKGRKKKKNVVRLRENLENNSYNKSLKYPKQSNSKGVMNINLTDAMKEKLLQKHNENSPKKMTSNQVRKSKVVQDDRFMAAKSELAENSKISTKGSATKLPIISRCNKTAEKAQKTGKEPATNSSKFKSNFFDILKNRSDISLRRFNTKLSYLERRQKESGFNPLSLRCNFQKCLSDSNRSNFGDSAVGDLPEISSRVSSVFRGVDKDEELFYLELIEKDKKKKLAQRSTRSEAQLETRRSITLIGSNSCKDRKELKSGKKTISGYKNNTKFTAIDMPDEFKSFSCSLKKRCHYCSLNSLPSVSKAELALKAKAYGLMANARNVFKLKNQSAVKSNVIDSRSQCDKLSEKSNTLSKARCSGVGDKLHNESLADVGSEKINKFNFTKPNELKSKRENGKILTENEKDAVVSVCRKPTENEGDFTAEILRRMRYCLDQDISYENLNYTNVTETCSEQVLPMIRTKI